MSFSLLILIMFSQISYRMDAVKQVNSVEEAVIVRASVSLKKKTENAELSTSLRRGTKLQEGG